MHPEFRPHQPTLALLVLLVLPTLGCRSPSKSHQWDSPTEEKKAPAFIYEERVLYCRDRGEPDVSQCQGPGSECCCGRECCSGRCADGLCADACAGAGEACTDLGESTQCCSGWCTGSGFCLCSDADNIPCRVDADCCGGFCNPDNSRCESTDPPDRKHQPAAVCETRGTRD